MRYILLIHSGFDSVVSTGRAAYRRALALVHDEPERHLFERPLAAVDTSSRPTRT